MVSTSMLTRSRIVKSRLGLQLRVVLRSAVEASKRLFAPLSFPLAKEVCLVRVCRSSALATYSLVLWIARCQNGHHGAYAAPFAEVARGLELGEYCSVPNMEERSALERATWRSLAMCNRVQLIVFSALGHLGQAVPGLAMEVINIV